MTSKPDNLSDRMKQRYFCHDYYERGIYMVTLEVEGRLLLLAPWPYHADHRRITREQCLALNAMAAETCGPGAAELNYAGLMPMKPAHSDASESLDAVTLTHECHCDGRPNQIP